MVTGYVPLPCQHRRHEAYAELGKQLLEVCPQAVVFRQQLSDCWLAQHLGDVQAGGKDSTAYHCVQHEKTAWLQRAAMLYPTRTLVWIDYGVLHLDAVEPKHIAAFLQSVAALPPRRITSPSCHDVGEAWDDRRVCWAFCGGVLVLPARDAAWLHGECVYERQHKPPTWEVNTWAAVARRHRDRFKLYPADHNQLMFTRYAA